ncbi:TDP-N-acetylfucosamine:lipid II N-acetylfucosaminyltransferase [Roseivirga spongicola]|uniref:TDP-N-acetylfucosamine:lipid II N-acetylfucosaminyltransferase n=1 Tax=Roseivirga spongicola TaxID=333140 RepID=UPI002AC8CA0C|nr:TDP-N-acetylfucosamine:lipid II N-acetylfucosaminyltransferase [Roseivirga spongicola]WPZ09168.1 TDP-N-acetylfucosamine:lipid II N-acetylfucosaminyltransferase [Roseivirga spongicola]
MNLHLFVDSPFVDRVIEKCEDYGTNHAYVVFTKRALKYVENSKVFVFRSYRDFKRETKLDFSKIHSVYLHFLSAMAIDFVLDNKKSFSYYWFFWGADGYALNELNGNLILERTKSIIPKQNLNFKGLVAARVKSAVRQRKLKRALSYVDYCCTWVEGDYQLIKSLGYVKMKFQFFSYLSLADLAGNSTIYRESTGSLKLLVGNSLNATNNHLDAIDFIQDIFPHDTELVLPVSYSGSKTYLDGIKDYANQTPFKYYYLESFIPLQEYLDIINSCDYILFFHIRQQSANNSLSALWMGKIIIMRSESTLFQFYQKAGLSVVSSEEISSMDDLEKKDKTFADRKEKNRLILADFFGREAVEKQYKDLFKR